MKQIGLILEGQYAETFLNELLKQEHNTNLYTLITQSILLDPHPQAFTLHHFDPTSHAKIHQAFPTPPDCLFLIQDDLKECEMIYQTLRQLFPHTLIITTQSLCTQDPLLKEISPSLLASYKLLSYLPNIPTPVQDIGLGKGEIIQIPVPSGSAYCYRTLGSIHQKGWKITGIYRNDELLMSSHSLNIQPNDKLLAIGNPQILNNIYRQITSSLGQFPIPFGKNLFLYLDEQILNENEILQSIDEALFLHKHLKSTKLYIIILHPQRFALLEHIKSILDEKIDLYIDYAHHTLQALIHSQRKQIGLAIIHHKIFHTIKQTLFELSIPTFKTARQSIQHCRSSLILLEENSNIASIAFDIASQLHLEFEIYDFDSDGKYHLEALESYKSLSQIFDKPIHLVQSQNKNPIFYLKEQKRGILQFLPFDPILTQNRFLNVTSTHATYHCANLTQNPQIFIPFS